MAIGVAVICIHLKVLVKIIFNIWSCLPDKILKLCMAVKLFEDNIRLLKSTVLKDFQIDLKMMKW